MKGRIDDPLTILRSLSYADQYKIRLCERMMRAGARWIQGHLKNVHIDYRESFGDKRLTITLTINIDELLSLSDHGTVKEHQGN